MKRFLDVTLSWMASIVSLGRGTMVGKIGPRPAKPLELYEFEACPFCRRVREALTVLDLDVMVYPCPKNGTRYRSAVLERGGRAQFPFLVDANTGTQLYESSQIIAHLFEHYGAASAPFYRRGLGPLAPLGALASALRLSKGRSAQPSRLPAKPLELYSFESSPYSRIAREALCSLELPYHLHNVAKKSASRQAFIERSGKMRVPYLIDPNTGTEMFESADIAAYLYQTYAT